MIHPTPRSGGQVFPIHQVLWEALGWTKRGPGWGPHQRAERTMSQEWVWWPHNVISCPCLPSHSAGTVRCPRCVLWDSDSQTSLQSRFEHSPWVGNKASAHPIRACLGLESSHQSDVGDGGGPHWTAAAEKGTMVAFSCETLPVLPTSSTSSPWLLLVSAHFQPGLKASCPLQELLHSPTHEQPVTAFHQSSLCSG